MNFKLKMGQAQNFPKSLPLASLGINTAVKGPTIIRYVKLQ